MCNCCHDDAVADMQTRTISGTSRSGEFPFESNGSRSSIHYDIHEEKKTFTRDRPRRGFHGESQVAFVPASMKFH